MAFCTNCGNQMPEDAKFCARCGRKMSPPSQAKNPGGDGNETEPRRPDIPPAGGAPSFDYRGDFNRPEVPQPPKSRLSTVLGGVAAVIAAVGLGLGASTLILGHAPWSDGEEFAREAWEDRDKGRDKEGEEETAAEDAQTAEPGAKVTDELLSEVTASLPSEADITRYVTEITNLNRNNAAEANTIDIFADNYKPGARNESYLWDKSLFYTLEDINPDKFDDGQINRYYVSRKEMRNATNGNKIQYEIYTNPQTNRVNKIVSIEFVNNILDLTDYYYDDAGKINFIFNRQDTNYVPSYAVPSKDGKRYFFVQDCMVEYRNIVNRAMNNQVIGLTQGGLASNQGRYTLYSSLSQSEKDTYDSLENMMLDAAYNTYNIVLDAESISTLTGYVYNESDQPVRGAKVQAFLGNTMMYEAQTDTNGLYAIAVPSEQAYYTLRILLDGCTPAYVYNVEVTNQVLENYLDPVYVVSSSGTVQSVGMEMYDALNYASDGNGMARIGGAQVNIRRGMNNKTGNIITTATADANGYVTVNLNPGVYTAQVIKQGFSDTFVNFAVYPNCGVVRVNASPQLASGEIRIVLTWGAQPADLDSHLFTPYDSQYSSRGYHIWYGGMSDPTGDNLDVDDTSSYGPETITIRTRRDGLYKYYVADYTNCSGGNPTSYQMSNSGATVNVFTESGLVATFHVPTNMAGVIWEVFEIRDGHIIPNQRYYSNINDKSWWSHE